MSWRGQHLTYAELSGRANQLAHHLVALGVRPGVNVILCVERSLEMIVGMLGILKAGGAYVPVDPAYPQQRVEFMLGDSQAPLILTQTSLRNLVKTSAARVVCLDADWPIIAARDEAPPATSAGAEDLAYVIYTSGSTGSPKGVQIRHRSVVHLLRATQPSFGFDERDVWTVFHSCAFDFSVWEIWGCLTSGGRLVIVPGAREQSPQDFYRSLIEEKVTVLSQTPSALRQLAQVREAQGAHGLALRLIVCGGETLRRPLSAILLTWGVPVWNFYGPTEATVWAVCGPIEALAPEARSAPIGRPISGYEIHLLDGDLQPVPAGVAGEIHIGGPGIAQGYLNNPELTQKKFIRHPFSDDVQARLYKTGDLARLLSDGRLEFLGRIDHQVKLRGFRIELGEIESVLERHPAVKRAVVVLRPDAREEDRIVAYFLSAPAAPAPGFAELRSFLSEALPDYMIPSAFVPIETLPLTAHGKLDSDALPAPEFFSSEAKAAAVAPRNEVESKLVALWERALKTRPIGVRDNFFDLGGDSILAVEVFLEIEEVFARKLPLATLFQAPTIEQLAALVVQEAPPSVWPSLVSLRPGGVQPPLFCVHPVGGNILEFRELVQNLAPGQPVYGLQSQGLDNQTTPYKTVEEMAAHYLSEIRSLQPHGPYFLTGLCFGALIAFEMAQQLAAQGETLGLLCMLDPDGPRPLSRLPGLRLLIHWQMMQSIGLRTYLGARIKRLRTRTGVGTGQASMPRAHREIDLTNHAALDLYVPKVFPGPITLVRASERFPAVDAWQLEWRKHAGGGLEVHQVPGNHVTMMAQPNVVTTARVLGECLVKGLQS